MAFILPATPSGRRRIRTFNSGVTRGENKRDLPTRIDARQALTIENFFIEGDGRMVSRQGLTEIIPGSFGFTPKMIEQCGDNTLMYAYFDGTDTILKKYSVSTATSETIHTYTGEKDINGVRAGEYFYFTSGRNSGYRPRCTNISAKFINYTTQTVAFTVGSVVQGVTSGATGTVLAVDTATLVLKSITGAFVSGEIISATSGAGSATTAGVLESSFELFSAPLCDYLEIMMHGGFSHLLAGSTSTQESEVKWSQAYQNTGIPFTNWSFTSSTAPKPYEGYFALRPRGGKLNSVLFHDSRIYSFYENALSISHLENLNVDNVGLIQQTIVDFEQDNYGGTKNAIGTKYGVFYGNEQGIFQITLGQTSFEGVQISNIISEEMKILDFTDSDIAWDGDRKLFITCKKDSSMNSLVKVYDIEKSAWTTITGWNIHRITRIQNILYGIDSVNASIQKLFDGYDDNGVPIECRILYKQEDLSDPTTVKKTKNFWVQGLLSASGLVRIDFNTWGKKNDLILSKKTLYWRGKETISETIEYGYSKQQLSEGYEELGTVTGENFAHKKLRLNNILKYQIELSSSTNTPLEIHFTEMEIEAKRKTRVNNLTTS